MSGDVDWSELALSHELTGGLIRNAILSALALAIRGQAQGEPVVLTQQHLINGAKLQLRCVTYYMYTEHHMLCSPQDFLRMGIVAAMFKHTSFPVHIGC